MADNGADEPFSIRKISLSFLGFLILQTILGVGWLVTMSNNVTILQRDLMVFEKRYEERARIIEILIDRLGQRTQERDTEQIRLIHDINIAAQRVQAQIDILNQQVRRLEEQQMRIVQALDQSYNLLQEHLRESGSRQQIPRPTLPTWPPP